MDKGLRQHALWTPQRRVRAQPPVFDNLASWRRHMISCDASAEQHGETTLDRVYMGGLPGRSVGLWIKGLQGGDSGGVTALDPVSSATNRFG